MTLSRGFGGFIISGRSDAGTLDPIATGVLPVFDRLRACEFAAADNKVYSARLLLISTDTQDITGK